MGRRRHHWLPTVLRWWCRAMDPSARDSVTHTGSISQCSHFTIVYKCSNTSDYHRFFWEVLFCPLWLPSTCAVREVSRLLALRARLICAADIVFKSNPPRCSLLSARDSATRHRRWAEVDGEGHYVSCRSLTGCMSVLPGCMMIQQACTPVRCTRVPSCGTLRALTPCCTLPTAALLGAVLAMMVDVAGSGTRLRGLQHLT